MVGGVGVVVNVWDHHIWLRGLDARNEQLRHRNVELREKPSAGAINEAVGAVRCVRVFGKPNPVMGNLVAAQVVLDPAAEQTAAEQEIRQRCAEKLDRYKRPLLIEFVDEIETLNAKLVRRTEGTTS